MSSALDFIYPDKISGRFPAFGAKINWDLIGDDAFVYNPSSQNIMEFRSKIFIGTEPLSNGSLTYGNMGTGRKWSGTSTANCGLDLDSLNPFTSDTAFSALIVASPVAESASRNIISQRSSSGSVPIAAAVTFNVSDLNTVASGYLGLGTNGSSAGQVRSISAASQFDGFTHSWVVSNSTLKGFIYRDGVSQTLFKDERIVGTIVNSSQKFKIGAGADASVTNGCHHPVYLIIGWPRQINEDLAKSLSMNPLLAFDTESLAIHFVPALPSVVLAGNAQSIAMASGVINQSVSLSGASVVIASATGAVNQSVGLAGAAASVSIADGIVSITTSLSGDGFVESFASGALASAIAMESAAQSAAASTGELSTGGELSGSASIQATAGGSLVLSVSLSGSALSEALGSANLDSGAANALNGDALASATGSGTLMQSVALLGDATVTVTSAGNVTSTQLLSGSAAVSALAGGDLQVSALGLSANAIADVLASGSIQISVEMSAAALSAALGVGTLAIGDLWSGAFIEKYTATAAERNYTAIA